MLLEHLVYSAAIAIVLGTLYRRYTGGITPGSWSLAHISRISISSRTAC